MSEELTYTSSVSEESSTIGVPVLGKRFERHILQVQEVRESWAMALNDLPSSDI